MNRKMTRFALPGKWGGLGAKGSSSATSCRTRAGSSREPATAERRKTRREGSVTGRTSIDVDELVAGQQHAQPGGPGLARSLGGGPWGQVGQVVGDEALGHLDVVGGRGP